MNKNDIIALAEKFINDSPNKPRGIIVFGANGSGKTTLGRELARILEFKRIDHEEYAFPGGGVMFGETAAETLLREFTEEIGEGLIEVAELKWIWENFYSYNNKPYHQICVYHLLKLKDTTRIPLSDKFVHKEYSEDDSNAVWFYWIPLNELDNISVHPANTPELLKFIDDGVQHFIFREEAK